MGGRGPGKHFRAGITLVELTAMFPDEAAAEAWLIRQRWPDGPRCPRCNSTDVQNPAKHPTMSLRCRRCRRYFSIRTATAMEASNLPLRTWVIALFLVCTNLKGTSSMKLHRDLGITQRSAWHLSHRIRKGLQHDGSLFTGPVEVDETYVGEKEVNKHADKKLRAGRGTVGKTAVVAVRDRSTGKVRGEVVPRTDAPTLQGFIFDNVDPAATVYTDDNRAYWNLPFEHQTVKHSVSQYVDGMAHTNGIESFWATLKRGYHGVFHHMSPKHLHRYIDEFAGRHGFRSRDTEEMMAQIFKLLVGTRLRYRDLVSGPPAYPDRRNAL